MKLWSGERLRAGTVLTALLAAAACSDSPSEPADDALPLEIHVLVGHVVCDLVERAIQEREQS